VNLGWSYSAPYASPERVKTLCGSLRPEHKRGVSRRAIERPLLHHDARLLRRERGPVWLAQLQTQRQQYHHCRQHPNEIRSISTHHTSPPSQPAPSRIHPNCYLSERSVDFFLRYRNDRGQDSLDSTSLSSRGPTQILSVSRVIGLLPKAIAEATQCATQCGALARRHLHADQDATVGSTMISVMKERDTVFVTQRIQKM